MVTGKQVLDLACTLIDEISESGSVVLDNPEYYLTKAKSILTMLQAELSDTTEVITDLDSELKVTDKIALSALPYGLAAHLLIADSDFETASYFNGRYDELKGKRKAKINPITNVYSGVE